MVSSSPTWCARQRRGRAEAPVETKAKSKTQALSQGVRHRKRSQKKKTKLETHIPHVKSNGKPSVILLKIQRRPGPGGRRCCSPRRPRSPEHPETLGLGAENGSHRCLAHSARGGRGCRLGETADLTVGLRPRRLG